ncbi:MAG TPA: helix-turn-helix domain-containing protein [Bacillota bacterium]|nr:helix-turn-helix domain-containing protein [Bacillota bacterium]
MRLTAIQIRYFLAIYQFSKKGSVCSAEIADSLGVSRPSTHRMLGQLLKEGLITKGKYTSIDLTESGRKAAEQYYDGFVHISRSLNECLNISTDAAEAGALAILSRLDVESLREDPQGIAGGTPPLI